MSNEAAPASSLTDKEREAIAQMPYEEARDKLIQAVQALEAGGLNLDQSMRYSPVTGSFSCFVYTIWLQVIAVRNPRYFSVGSVMNS